MELKEKGFKCLNCERFVPVNQDMAAAHRNHCPFCLWSKHVDLKEAGDRKSSCLAGMEPIGLTFKKEVPDKYKPEEKGELMIVHQCSTCGKISLNRIAADDDPQVIISLLAKSKTLDNRTKEKLIKGKISLLNEDNLEEIKTQLFGT